MIDSIAVKNFQSLYDVEVPLSPFTVIVGPSSTGKSAFIRATRLLLQNQRGMNFISHGEHTASVSAIIDGHALVIRRGKTNEYALHIDQGPAETYTKLGGEVPEEVQNFLGIDTSLSIAGQFDPPYLLTASGGEVARTLGSLTNVEVVLSAGREASRRRLQASSTVRSLQEALAHDEEEFGRYSDAQSVLEAILSAEALLVEVEEASAVYMEAFHTAAEVQGLLQEYRGVDVVEVPETKELFRDVEEAIAEEKAAEVLLQEIAQISLRLEMLQVVEVPVVDFDDVEEAHAAARAGEIMLADLQRALLQYRNAAEDEDVAAQAKAEAVAEYGSLLAEAGVCPTCGQETAHLHA